MRISYEIDTGIWNTVFLSGSDTKVFVCRCPTSNALFSLGDPPLKIVLIYTLPQCSHVLNVQFSLMKLQVYTSCSCVCCYFGFLTACRFLSCTVPRRRFLQLIDRLPVLLIAFDFFTRQTFVYRRLSKDLFVGRIGCIQPFHKFPRHGDSGVSSFQMVHFVLICPRCSSYSCSLLGLN